MRNIPKSFGDYFAVIFLGAPKMRVCIPARSLLKAPARRQRLVLENLMSIKRILCPTDLTSGSDEALRYAVALTRAYEAKLVAFHCKPENGDAEVVQNEIKVSLEQTLLRHLESAELAAIDWQPAVERCDDPGRAIAEYAARTALE